MEEDDKRLTSEGANGGWHIDNRTRNTFARYLELGYSMIFLLPANLVTNADGGNAGLAIFRSYFSCCFGCTKVKSRTRGDKRQVLVYNECNPDREQDLVRFGVSAARRFGQKETFFIDRDGFGYMISSSDDGERPLGEEYLSDGVNPVSVPTKIAVEDILKHIETLLGERFCVASDTPSRIMTDAEYFGDGRRDIIRQYGYDCLDCICPGVFTYWQDYPADTMRDRLSCELVQHTSLAVVVPRNVVKDEEWSHDRFEGFTLQASFGYFNVYSGSDDKKKAMILCHKASRYDDTLFLYFAVSAGRLFREADILYVNPQGYARRVSCWERDGHKVGDETPIFTDANGAERRATVDEFISLLENIAGDDLRMSEFEKKYFNGVSGMAMASLLRGLNELKYDALSRAKKPIVEPDGQQVQK